MEMIILMKIIEFKNTKIKIFIYNSFLIIEINIITNFNNHLVFKSFDLV